jgi:hypothetical protein
MLIFGEAGWDVVADYSVDLDELIEPVAEPYQSIAEDGDRGYSVIVLPSPGALERGDPVQLVVEHIAKALCENQWKNEFFELGGILCAADRTGGIPNPSLK